MGSSSKRKKETGKKKKKKEKSRSKSKERERDKHHRHRHHKHRKHKRVREEKSRSKSLSLSDLSLSDSDFVLPSHSSANQGKGQREELPSCKPKESTYPEEVSYPRDAANYHRERAPAYPPDASYPKEFGYPRETAYPCESSYPPPQPSTRHEQAEAQKSSGGGDEISLSVEETNRLRLKMGLKPLKMGSNVVSAGDEPSQDDVYIAGLEVHRPPENLRDKLQVEKLRTKIAAQREKRKLTQRMKKVKGLGESDDDENASEWVKKSRLAEKQRKEAELRNKMLDEVDEQFGLGDLISEEVRHEKKRMYNTKNLSGMKVQHDTNRFVDGSSTILTLKDSNILENDEDTLVNVNLVDLEHAEKNVKRKLKKKDTDEEMDLLGDTENNVLDKYDVEIEGEKRQSFRIGSGGDGAFAEITLAKTPAEKMEKLRKMTTLDRPEFQLATEYMTEGESSSFKKVKKKKRTKRLRADDLIPVGDELEHLGRRGEPRGIINVETRVSSANQVKNIRQLIEEDDEEEGSKPVEEAMEVEEGKDESESERDDFELQEALSRSRRAQLASQRMSNFNPVDNLSESMQEDVKPSINALR